MLPSGGGKYSLKEKKKKRKEQILVYKTILTIFLAQSEFRSNCPGPDPGFLDLQNNYMEGSGSATIK